MLQCQVNNNNNLMWYYVRQMIQYNISMKTDLGRTLPSFEYRCTRNMGHAQFYIWMFQYFVVEPEACETCKELVNNIHNKEIAWKLNTKMCQLCHMEDSEEVSQCFISGISDKKQLPSQIKYCSYIWLPIKFSFPRPGLANKHISGFLIYESHISHFHH